MKSYRMVAGLESMSDEQVNEMLTPDKNGRVAE